MTVAFKNIPASQRVPLFYAEMDNSQANTATQNQRALIIGQITSAGTVPANIPLLSQGVSDAKTVAGQGSMLALMVEAYRNNDDTGEVWCLPLADDPAAVAATGSILFTAVPTAAGTLSLYIMGTRVTMLVTAAQTTAQLATALAAALTAVNDLPVTAVVDGAVNSKVNLTAKNAGAGGNDIDLQFNFGGVAAGEALPTGLAATITAMANGATNPVLTTALTNLVDMPFDFIILPYTDTTSLDALKSFLDDATGRWAWSVQVYGHCFAFKRGSLGTLQTLGAGRNDQHTSIAGMDGTPTSGWLAAAQYGAAAAVSLRADPALPLQTIAVKGLQPPPINKRLALSARNTLLYNGISTFTTSDDATVRIENIITTYQKNKFNQPDNSYLQVETMFTAMAVLRFLKTRITSKYGQSKLADNSIRLPTSNNIVTPNMIRGEMIAAYNELCDLGWCDNQKLFAKYLVVERDTQNRSRVNMLFPPQYMGALRVFAVLNQFRL